MVLKSSSKFGPNKAQLHACFLRHERKGHVCVTEKAKCWRVFIEFLAPHLEKWLLINAQKCDPPTAQTSVVRDLNGNTGGSDGDYLWSEGAFFQDNKHEGKSLGCPKSDLNTRHLDEMSPILARCRTESFLKTIPHIDNILSLNMCKSDMHETFAKLEQLASIVCLFPSILQIVCTRTAFLPT